jgi:hypothetical protein
LRVGAFAGTAAVPLGHGWQRERRRENHRGKESHVCFHLK